MALRAAFAGAVLTLLSGAAVAELIPDRLRCEYLTNPLGIDVTRPRLSWILQSAATGRRGEKQTAYRIVVASRAELLESDQGDLWDSGRVASSETIHHIYSGKPLKSRMQCYWK